VRCLTSALSLCNWRMYNRSKCSCRRVPDLADHGRKRWCSPSNCAGAHRWLEPGHGRPGSARSRNHCMSIANQAITNWIDAVGILAWGRNTEYAVRGPIPAMAARATNFPALKSRRVFQPDHQSRARRFVCLSAPYVSRSRRMQKQAGAICFDR
jgi:hypothetical protein